jgi:hypothetical protein
VTLLLGYYHADSDKSAFRSDQSIPAGMEVFVAWDAVAHLKVGLSSSCQVDFAVMYEAYLKGVASATRELASGRTETIVAFRPERLPAYLDEVYVGHERALTSREKVSIVGR